MIYLIYIEFLIFNFIKLNLNFIKFSKIFKSVLKIISKTNEKNEKIYFQNLEPKILVNTKF